jgi:hypothetical protein
MVGDRLRAAPWRVLRPRVQRDPRRRRHWETSPRTREGSAVIVTRRKVKGGGRARHDRRQD